MRVDDDGFPVYPRPETDVPAYDGEDYCPGCFGWGFETLSGRYWQTCAECDGTGETPSNNNGEVR